MSIRSISTFTAGAMIATLLTFTGMQSWQAGAAPGDTDTTFVPTPPCRLLDTRSGPNNVGIRSAALGPGEVFPTQVTGSNGECIGIPNDATAVSFNVTIVAPTASSFLTLFPADLATPPKASNLNWVAGQSPTPNKVDVKLSPDGKVKLFNNLGDVDVIADIVGYYTPSSQNISQSRDGTLLVFASATAVEFEAGADVQCVITNSETQFTVNKNMRWEAAGDVNDDADEGDASNLAGTESFDITAGTNSRCFLMCQVLADMDGATMWSPQLTLIFIADR